MEGGEPLAQGARLAVEGGQDEVCGGGCCHG
jgi:hypothetical protein